MSENHLRHETSPYLLQHKDNPVHWWAWGPEALAEAKRTRKPILLSVGYAACHWCHVMAHESFEDPATADVMNKLFVNIKVDREERPDIDAIYMSALHRLGEQGGWPLTMFLDAEARPFFGGTYFPKQSQYGRPAFVSVLLQIAQVYQNEPERIRHNVDGLMAALSAKTLHQTDFQASEDLIRTLVTRLTEAFDHGNGGIAGAPKFPQWNVLWLMWRGAMRYGDEAAKEAVVNTLTHICQGGIYDHLGGGFARYSVDELWLVPHFEKMLYDNALLVDLLTEVWRETQEPLFAVRVAETIAWLEREMITPGGGFAASLDADSEGEEGKFYVWSADEITEVLGEADAADFMAIYGVTTGGNFEGHNILNRLDHLQLQSVGQEARLEKLRDKLLARRAGRIRPGFDDKVLADWNGLIIGALARAGVVFAQPDWIRMADAAFAFVSTAMRRDSDRLWHSARNGRLTAPATASDYANMIWAALRLFQAHGDPGALARATQWAEVLDRHHWDVESGGYFTSADDTDDVIVRLKSAHDDAVPSANAVHLTNLIWLNALTSQTAYSERTTGLYNCFQGDIARGPVGHCGLLAAGLDMDGLVQIVLAGSSNDASSSLRRVAVCTSVPGALEFLDPVKGARPLPVALGAKLDVAVTTTGYICVGPVCGPPVFEPDELKERLLKARSAPKA
ncbi:MAG: thioredoxin domain-containing protein [Hyphomicrobiaceae bacterium]